jgi:hypothetical protein
MTPSGGMVGLRRFHGYQLKSIMIFVAATKLYFAIFLDQETDCILARSLVAIEADRSRWSPSLSRFRHLMEYPTIDLLEL